MNALEVEGRVKALSTLPREMQVRQVTKMLYDARSQLQVAIAAQDIPSIVQWKAKAGAIQEMTKQIQLGKDMQLDAGEFLRRAERGLGVAIRRGQEDGIVETPSEGRSRGGVSRQGSRDTQEAEKARPTDFATSTELSGTGTSPGIYDITDGISEQVFEEALAEARQEENLSRANVARKARAKATPNHPSHQKADVVPIRKGTSASGGMILERVADMLESIVLQSLAHIDPTDLDKASPSFARIEKAVELIHQSIKEMQDGN